MKVEGKGTGRISDDAAKEAARRAAAEAAKRAAEAARARAAEAAAKRAAESAQKAAQEAGRHTGRLTDTAQKMDLGKTPWEKGEKVLGAAAAGVAALTGATAYRNIKDAISVKKKADDVKETVSKLRDVIKGGTGALKGGGASTLGKVLTKTDGTMKVVGGVKSALNLKNSLGALRDGVTKEELITASRDVLGTVRGVDSAVKLAGKGGILGKFNPVVAVAAATTDIADRANKLKNWNQMSTKDKVANIAGLGASVADIVGAVTPPPVKFAAMGVSAGLSLVTLGAENFDKISAGAKKVAAVADKAVDAVADKAKETVDDVKNAGKKALDFGKKVFSGW
jgi:hypothetical protein